MTFNPQPPRQNPVGQHRRINRSHPSTAGLGLAWAPSLTLADQISGISPYFNDSDFTRVPRPIGPSVALTPVSANPGIHFGTSHPLATTVTGFTFLVVADGSGIPGDFATLISIRTQGGNYPTFSLVYDFSSAGDVGLLIQHHTSLTQFTALTSGGFWDGRPACFIGVYSGSRQTIELYSDGKLVASAAFGQIATVFDGAGLSIGNLGSLDGLGLGAGYSYGGNISLACGWDRALSAEEAKSLGENPWQLFAESSPRRFVPVAFDAGAPAPIELAGTAAGTASAAGSLTTSIRLAGAAQAAATATGALSMGIPLAGSAAASAAALGALATSIRLAGLVNATATATASLQLYDVDVAVTPQEGSSVANWSYTATGTHWARTALNDWTRVATFAAPVEFLCDYKVESSKAVDSDGEEFVSKLTIYTGRANIKRGDYIMIGESSSASPIGVEGAREVRSVTQYADTFERIADDYTLHTI